MIKRWSFLCPPSWGCHCIRKSAKNNKKLTLNISICSVFRIIDQSSRYEHIVSEHSNYKVGMGGVSFRQSRKIKQHDLFKAPQPARSIRWTLSINTDTFKYEKHNTQITKKKKFTQLSVKFNKENHLVFVFYVPFHLTIFLGVSEFQSLAILSKKIISDFSETQ